MAQEIVREHRTTAVETLAGPLHRTRRRDPQSAAHLRRQDRRRSVRRSRCAARSTKTSGTPPTTTPKKPSPSASTRPAGWPTGRSPADRIKARTREHYSAILDDHLLPMFGHRQLAAIKPKDVRDWYAATLADRPTMRSHAYSPVADHPGVRGQRRTASTPTRPASSAPAEPNASTRSGPPVDRGTRRAHRGDARAAAAHGHAGVMVCAAVRGDRRTAPRRHRFERRSDPHPPRSRTHERHVHRSPRPRVTPGYATSTSRRTSSRPSRRTWRNMLARAVIR